MHTPACEVDFTTPPYPLTPGTVNIGSKECFKCGHKGHYSRECGVTPAEEVNAREQRWRAKIGRILFRARRLMDTVVAQISSSEEAPVAYDASIYDAASLKFDDDYYYEESGNGPERTAESSETQDPSSADGPSGRDVFSLDRCTRQYTSNVLAYDAPITELLLQLTSTEDNNQPKSKPFMQRIQLVGPDQVVRATGQIDDGAMRDCISKKRWMHYGHCLTPLQPSRTRIGVANGAKLKAMGTWTGTVRVGGTEAETTFEVFDCSDAFDVILGKPWLRHVRALHDYVTDEIIMRGPGEPETISNQIDELDDPIPEVHAVTETTVKTEPTTQRGWRRQDIYEAEKAAKEANSTEEGMLRRESEAAESAERKRAMMEKDTAKTSDPEREMADEWVRIHLLQDSTDPWAETRWGEFLSDKSNCYPDREDKPADEWLQQFHSEPEPPAHPIHQQQRDKWNAQRDRKEAEVLLTAHIHTVKQTPHTLGCAPRPKFSKATRDTATEQDAERWRLNRQKINVEQLFGIDSRSTSSKQELANLLQSEIRIKQLRNKIDTLRDMALTAMGDDTQAEDHEPVNAIGDVRADEFKIDRGDNQSPRVVEPFAEARVEEILKQIDIGPDLNDDQREKVRDLIREYADVFALSLSEVFFVDWYKHKLNIPPDTKFPTRINQRPVTEAQKMWFSNILDDMETAHIIQKVPGTFIKSLSSTNLAPKEAGKTGLTRTEILRSVNAECIRNGLPPFWEEAMEPGETNEALLEAVEGETPHQVKTKWRLAT
ncbi:hypothetical protein D9615_003277 [Tricholomella constricta]|uniref:CCHC-type domain-containing protein n=1 Tax=Tricholomella constricta TaxID=117010 RepID=A0A8H5M7I0_9AGAR|nr:hypothetical protein D9615_003277 [Tricholomella constricta]